MLAADCQLGLLYFLDRNAGGRLTVMRLNILQRRSTLGT